MKFQKVFLFLVLFLPMTVVGKDQPPSVVGLWRLESYVILKDGKETQWCPSYVGTIEYSERKRMSVSINCKDENGAWMQDYRNMVFYSGTYAVRGDQITHFVENASDITRIGNDHVRTFKFDPDGNRVTLVGKGTKGDVKLVWKRATLSP